jgi:hypothetical protein
MSSKSNSNSNMNMNTNKVIYDADTMNIKNIKYNALNKNEHGQFFCPKSKICIKSPTLKTFGVSEYDGKHYISFMLEEGAFLQSMVAFENELKNHAKEIFGKDTTITMGPVIKYSKTSNLPSLKVKIANNIKKKEWDFTMFDEERKQIYPCKSKKDEINPFDYIIAYSEVNVMLQFNGFFVSEKDGIAYPSLSLHQIKVTKPVETECEL